mgnify:CR=1 FL=1
MEEKQIQIPDVNAGAEERDNYTLIQETPEDDLPKTNVYRSMQDINISLMQRVIFIRDKEVPDKKGKPNYKILH